MIYSWLWALWIEYVFCELYITWSFTLFEERDISWKTNLNIFKMFFYDPMLSGTVGVNAQYIWVGIKAVDVIFGPVTWHHQGRPFVCVSACKTAKTRWELARKASSDDQVSQVSKKGEKERVGPSKIDSNTPFYTPVCCMFILPLSTTRLHVDVWYHLWLHLTGLINTEGC
jgi:hypothetical protein